MPDRAIIIAIEKYDQAKGLVSSSLTGIHDAAHTFFDWIRTTKNIPPQNIFICSDAPADDPIHAIAGDMTAPVTPVLYGSTRAEIRRAMFDLLNAGSRKTENFFLYAAGHGFEFVDGFQQPVTSILITSEYQDMQTGGDACINLDELQLQLPRLLSGFCHFYFVDACRNQVKGNQINPVSLGLSFQDPGTGEATQFTLYSARAGQTAPADAAFSDALLNGLKGDGHAKTRSQGKMFVTFPGVWSYMVDTLQRPLEKRIKGTQPGQIYELPPPVTQQCILTILDAEAGDGYIATFTSGGLCEAVPFTGATYVHPLSPNDAGYQVQVTKAGQTLIQISPVPETFIDMYDDCSFTFSSPPLVIEESSIADGASEDKNLSAGPVTHFQFHKTAGYTDSIGGSSSRVGAVHLSIPEKINWNDPEWAASLETLNGAQPLDAVNFLPAGLHTINLTEDGVSVWKKTIHLKPGEVLTTPVGEPAPSPFQRAVTSVFEQAEVTTPELSELFGRTADWDMSLWLAVLGTANIRPMPGYYTRLNLIDVENAPPLAKDLCGLLILVVSEGGTPSFAVHSGTRVNWQPLQSVSNIETLFFAYAILQEGPQFVSLRFEGKQPVTYSTYGQAGVYTLFTAVLETTLSVQQLFVPAPAVDSSWSPPELTDLRLAKVLSTAQRLHRDRQPLAEQPFVPDALWSRLKQGTWQNTQLRTLAAFDLKRQGRSAELPAWLDDIEDRDPMGDDLASLRAAVKSKPIPDNCRPLLLDSMLLDTHYEDRELPFPVTRINFNNMWVSWYAAISEEDAPEKVFAAAAS